MTFYFIFATLYVVVLSCSKTFSQETFPDTSIPNSRINEDQRLATVMKLDEHPVFRALRNTKNKNKKKKKENFDIDLTDVDFSKLFEDKMNEIEGPAQSGVSFEREVNVGSDRISGAVFFDGNFCDKQDAFGDNDCSYRWGSSISGNLEVTANITLDVGDTLGGDVTVTVFFIPIYSYDVVCQACGADCVIVNPTGDDLVIELPPCPIIIDATAESFDFAIELPSSSPIGGIGASVDATAFLAQQGRKIYEVIIDGSIR